MTALFFNDTITLLKVEARFSSVDIWMRQGAEDIYQKGTMPKAGHPLWFSVWLLRLTAWRLSSFIDGELLSLSIKSAALIRRAVIVKFSRLSAGFFISRIKYNILQE